MSKQKKEYDVKRRVPVSEAHEVIKIDDIIMCQRRDVTSGQFHTRKGRVERIDANHVLIETEDRGYRSIKWDTIDGNTVAILNS